MNMIRHETKRKNLVLKSLTGLPDDIVKAITVLVIVEHILTGIATKNYMVNCTRCVYSRLA